MKLKVFSIFDSKAEAFNTPFFFNMTGQALRAFEDLAKDPQAAISKHPEDYTLFEIGEFDTDTGQLIPLPTPHSLGLAITQLGETEQ